VSERPVDTDCERVENKVEEPVEEPVTDPLPVIVALEDCDVAGLHLEDGDCVPAKLGVVVWL